MIYDFRYEDEDTVSNEIDEFYSYVEMPQVAENFRAWYGSFNGGISITKVHECVLTLSLEWTKSSAADRRGYVEILLESLEHRDAEVRFLNSRRLFYILQGSRVSHSACCCD